MSQSVVLGAKTQNKRSFLRSYHELLFLLNKYPPIPRYPASKLPTQNKKSKDATTQTSPQPFHRYLIMNDTDKTFVMTPSPQQQTAPPNCKSSRTHNLASISRNTVSPTVIMTPSPATKNKRDCGPFTITPPKQVLFIHAHNNAHNGNAAQTTKTTEKIRVSAIQASDVLLTSLTHDKHSVVATGHVHHRSSRKRCLQQIMHDNEDDEKLPIRPMDLAKTFSQCNIQGGQDEDHRPLKRRKTQHRKRGESVHVHTHAYVSPPKTKQQQRREQSEQLVLQYYNLEMHATTSATVVSTKTKKSKKPKLQRSTVKNNQVFNLTNLRCPINSSSHARPSAQCNSHESIESVSASPIAAVVQLQHAYVQHQKRMSSAYKSKTFASKNNISMNNVMAKDSMPRSLSRSRRPPNNTANEAMNDPGRFLVSSDEHDINQCEPVVSTAVRFESHMHHHMIPGISNISHISTAIDDDGDEMITVRAKYTPLWKASQNKELPADETMFDVNKLKAAYNVSPLHRFDERYLNENNTPPSIKTARQRLSSPQMQLAAKAECSGGKVEQEKQKDEPQTHSQIIKHYQNNVAACFVDATVAALPFHAMNESKASLFDDTDFSGDAHKVNSLLNDSSTQNEDKLFEDLKSGKYKKNNGGMFEYPDDD